MHRSVFYNQEILPFEQIHLPANSAAALYGKGVFTTIAVYNGKPFLWEKHWHRLIANSKKIGVDLFELTEEKIKDALLKITAENNFKHGRARITIFDESAGSVWQTASIAKTNFLIQTADFRRLKKNLKLTVSPFRINSTSPLAGVKSCNYLENILALENVRARDFDEAIRLNERGEIVSACMANVFWKKNGTIFTPGFETGCLEGTTRSFILESFRVEEKSAKLIELKIADEIFLTSAGIGIVKVKCFECEI